MVVWQELQKAQEKLKELEDVNANQSTQHEASQRLKNITMELETLKDQVERKLQQIEGLQLIFKYTLCMHARV